MLFSRYDMSENSFFPADDNNYSYMGRIDFTNPKAPVIIYAGSTITTRFTGTSVRIVLENLHFYADTYVGYILDGIQDKLLVTVHGKIAEFELASGLAEGEHDLTVFKRMDATHYFNFHGLILDKTAKLLPPAPKPSRRMECFGDSVSAGAVCEAVYYTEHVDPENNGEYDNAWFSYSMSAARKLHAQINNNAQGGIALFDRTGYFNGPDTTGLVSTYDKLKYCPAADVNTWDFSRYTPHVVIMAIGQNDNYPKPDVLSDKSYRLSWKESYKNILRALRKQYPNALFVLITTVLCHEKCWDDALDEIKAEMNDPKIVRFLFRRNGAATPGHPRIAEEEEMAVELAGFLECFGEEIWA